MYPTVDVRGEEGAIGGAVSWNGPFALPEQILERSNARHLPVENKTLRTQREIHLLFVATIEI